MVTTNERSFMVASIVAVATIWAPAPSSTQGQNINGTAGHGSPVAARTAIRKTAAKGKPNRKRTWVAPTVPSAAVNSRCIALRAVWPAAANRVNGIQSTPVAIIDGQRSRRLQDAGFAVSRPLGDLAVLVVDQQEQVKIANGRIAAGALLDAFTPLVVVTLPCSFDRRPDINARAGAFIVPDAKPEMLAQQIWIRRPLRDRTLGVLQHMGAIPARRRLECHHFQNHGRVSFFGVEHL